MYGLNRLTLAAAAAARIYRKRPSPVRSIPIFHRSLSSAYERKRLPAELSEGVTAQLTCDSSAPGGVCDVYVIGTEPDTQESREKVKAVMQFVKPQVVFLELCPKLGYILESHKEGDKKSEFYVANEEAKKYRAKIVLGNRPAQITLLRFSILGFMKDVRNMYYFETRDSISSFINMYKGKMDNQSMNLRNGEIARMFPTHYQTITHECDQYMAAKLLEVASQHNSVVAVVGMSHVQGIQEQWKQPVDMQEILRVPIGKRIFVSILVIGAPVALIYLIHKFPFIFAIIKVILKLGRDRTN